jgi:hypothetical protein
LITGSGNSPIVPKHFSWVEAGPVMIVPLTFDAIPSLLNAEYFRFSGLNVSWSKVLHGEYLKFRASLIAALRFI